MSNEGPRNSWSLDFKKPLDNKNISSNHDQLENRPVSSMNQLKMPQAANNERLRIQWCKQRGCSFSLSQQKFWTESGWQNWFRGSKMLGPPSLQFPWPVLCGCKRVLLFRYPVHIESGEILHLFYPERKALPTPPAEVLFPLVGRYY